MPYDRRSSRNGALRHPVVILEGLEARQLFAISTTVTGFTPAQIRHAYEFDQISLGNSGVTADGSGQTIAIVDAFNDPNIAADLAVFDKQFDLPTADLSVVNQTGGKSLPTTDAGWAGEIALDVEWAHAIAPGAKILLVEATSDSIDDLTAAVDFARNFAGVSAVSMSWGGSEFFSWSGGESQRQTSFDPIFTTPTGHQGVTFVASAGDSGAQSGVMWPSISPNVISVGGTSLFTSDDSGTYAGELGWSGTNGGFSQVEAEPRYQLGAQNTGVRTSPDVAYNADPNTGFAVYDSLDFQGVSGWEEVGGTSAGAPQWAALVAIANQGRAINGLGSLDGASETLPALYAAYATAESTTVSADYATTYQDVTRGGSGGYRWRWGGFGSSGYNAQPGYDLVTGLGSPQAGGVVNVLMAYGATSNGTSPTPTPTPTPTPAPQVLPPSPIQVTSVSSPGGSVIDGAHGTTKVTLTNTGSDTYSGGVTVTLYASADGSVSADDATLVTLELPKLKLAAGKSKVVKLSFTYPTSLPGGSYQLIAVADATNTGTATASGVAPSAVAVTPAILDLAAAFNTDAAISVKPGHNETAVITLTNTGNVAAVGTVDLNLLASLDSVLDASDVILGSLTGRAINLAPGKSVTMKVRFAAPVDGTPGDYELIASIASSTTPADTNAANDVDVAPTFFG
jgi:subtilase family serine protease